jgi:uncharacterized membrane protein
MALQFLFGFIGLIIGAFFGSGGWLFGALLGFLMIKVLQMGQLVRDQAKEISLLKSMQEYLHLTLRNLQANSEEPKQAEVKSTEIRLAEIKPAEIKPTATQPASSPETQQIAAKEVQDIIQVKENIPESVIAEAPKTQSPSRIIPAQTTIPKQPAAPALGDKIGDAIRNFFLGGNPVVRVGMLILFFGLSFLVKYAASGGYFPIELRLSCVGIIAIVLIAIGWKTRNKEGSYGLVLQGGGLAALYLTSFAAAKMYEVMPDSAALVLLFVFVVFGVVLALLQNAQVLAIMATAGGFLAPILTSDGSGNHLGLFSVYLVLNIGIFAISWFKAWRLLNWIGFVFTFIITAVWGVLKYEPQFYLSTQPFLIAFFLLYLIISILFSLKQPPNLKGLVDGSLVFGLPVAAFSLQVALLKHTEYGLAISALILAFVYIGLARWLWLKYLQTHRLLVESFLALGVGFATLAIPLGLNADWTSATWAFEAAGLVWIGLRQQRLLPRCAGIILYFAACIATLADNGLSAGQVPIISGDFISLIILSLAGFLIAYCFFRFANNASLLEHGFGKSLLVISVIWWLGAVILELNHHMTRDNMCASFYFIIAASLLLQIIIAKKLDWSSLGKAGHVYLLFSIFWTLWGFLDHVIPFPTGWMLGLPFVVFLSAQYYFIWRLEKIQWGDALQFVHLASSLLVLLLLLWQATGVADYTNFLSSVMHRDTAQLFIWFMVFVPAVVLLIGINSRTRWPLDNWKTIYQDVIPVPFILITLGWFFIAIKQSGSIFEFYLPVLNPLDLAQLTIIILSGFVLLRGLVSTYEWPILYKTGLIGLLVFIWVNTVTLRAIHQYTQIDYDFSTLWQSSNVQMALSILWSVCALVVMNLSRKMQNRTLWIVGAGLLLMVVLKLFTKDLSNSGTVARIVSFMAVGGLMLLIGYISPMPPTAKNAQEPSK